CATTPFVFCTHQAANISTTRTGPFSYITSHLPQSPSPPATSTSAPPAVVLSPRQDWPPRIAATMLSFDGSCDFRHCVTTTLIRDFRTARLRQTIQPTTQHLIGPPSRTEHRACHLPGFVWCEQNFAAPVMR